MDRTEALQFYEMYKLQKEYGRNIYPVELRGHRICSGKSAKNLVEKLLASNALAEENVQGANTYRITRTGMAMLESYLDIRREIARGAAK